MNELLNPVTQHQRTWVILGDGRVVRKDKVKKDIVIPDSFPDPDFEGERRRNHFSDREEAYVFRDSLTDAFPTSFLDQSMPDAVAPMPDDKTEDVADDSPESLIDPTFRAQRRNFSQEEFQKLTRKKAFQYYDVFWQAFLKLKPKDQCDVYMKMARYGFAQAPNLKPMDEEQRQKQEDRKTAEVADAIRQGLPQLDDDFEEEDD